MSSAVLDVFLFSTHRLLVRLFAVWVRFVCFQQRNNLDARTSSSALRVATVHATDQAVGHLLYGTSTSLSGKITLATKANGRNETDNGPGGGQTVARIFDAAERPHRSTDLELDLPGSGHRCCYCSDGTAGPAVILIRFIRSSSVGLDNT